jgi:hypothetical protein
MNRGRSPVNAQRVKSQAAVVLMIMLFCLELPCVTDAGAVPIAQWTTPWQVILFNSSGSTVIGDATALSSFTHGGGIGARDFGLAGEPLPGGAS